MGSIKEELNKLHKRAIKQCYVFPQLLCFVSPQQRYVNPTCLPILLRKPHSLCAASVTSTPNLTAKKGRDCGHTDATSTLCFDTSHFWQGTQKKKGGDGGAQRGTRHFPDSLSGFHRKLGCAWNLVERQNPLDFLQALLGDLQTLLVWHAAFAGEAGAQQ